MTLGGRYTSDRRCLDLRQYRAATTLLTQNGCATFDKFTYRASLDHHFTKDVMVYAQASRGFKSGFFNSQTPQFDVNAVPVDRTKPLAVRPEVLDAYEIGLKSELLDRRVRLNVSGFYYDYKDLQVNAFLNATTRVVLNAAKARIYGLDADLTAAVSESLTLSLSGSAIDAKYNDFPGGPVFTPRAGPPFGIGTSQANLAGNHLISAPSFTGSFSAAYETPLASGTLKLKGAVNYTSDLYFDTANRLKQPGYALLSGQIAWTSDTGLSLTVWGRNLTNHKYYYTINPTAFLDNVTVAEPRAYGVKIGYRF